MIRKASLSLFLNKFVIDWDNLQKDLAKNASTTINVVSYPRNLRLITRIVSRRLV